MKQAKDKIINLVFSVSMVLMGICTTVSGITNLTGLVLPDVAARIMGSVQMLSLVTMVYSAVNKFRSEKKLPVDVNIPVGEKEA